MGAGREGRGHVFSIAFRVQAITLVRKCSCNGPSFERRRPAQVLAGIRGASLCIGFGLR